MFPHDKHFGVAVATKVGSGKLSPGGAIFMFQVSRPRERRSTRKP